MELKNKKVHWILGNAEYFITCHKPLAYFYRKEILTNSMSTEIYLDCILWPVSYSAVSTFRLGCKSHTALYRQRVAFCYENNMSINNYPVWEEHVGTLTVEAGGTCNNRYPPFDFECFVFSKSYKLRS